MMGSSLVSIGADCGSPDVPEPASPGPSPPSPLPHALPSPGRGAPPDLIRSPSPQPSPQGEGVHLPPEGVSPRVPPLPGGRECVWERGLGGEGPGGAGFFAWVCAALFLLLSLPVPAAAADEPAPIEISRAVSPIRVDGVLDEPAWQQATAISVDHEWFPGDNVPVPISTTALITYDDEHLYVAFRAADPEPGLIRARFADRDVPTDDDTVGFLIDPFNDGRRAFQFRINPLGVQMDAVNSDVEGTEDFSWDAIWNSAGRVTAEGYEVEVALPFRQLRFPATSGVQTWGFMATREWPRSVLHRLRSIVTDQDLNCSACQLQDLTGIQQLETGRNLEVTPTLTGNLSEEREGFPEGRFETSRQELEPGVSARWGVTPNVALNLTIN